MKLKEGLIINQIDDEYILVDLGAVEPIFNGMIKLNETSKIIVELLMKNNVSFEEIVSTLCEQFDVDKTIVKNDVKDVVNQLKNEHLIIDEI